MSDQNSQKLADLACKYLKYLSLQKSTSGHTSKSYANDLSQFLEPVGVQKILYTSSTLGPSFQIRWRESSRIFGLEGLPELILGLIRESHLTWKPLAASSRGRKVACVRGFLKWCFAEKILDDDFSTRLMSPKVVQKLPHFLSVDEALALVRGLPAGPQRTLVLLLYGGGLRVSEACSLRWKDLTSGARSLRVMGKGGRERVIAVPEMVWKSVQELPKTNTYIFGAEAPLSTRKAYEWVRQSGITVGLLKPLHPHALRHSYATHLLTSGADLRVLQELLGHRSLAATQKYTHLSLDHLARMMENHHPLSASKLKKDHDVD